MPINSTQLAGLIAFCPAASAAAAAFVSGWDRPRKHCFSWAIISAIHSLLAIEVLALARHRIDRMLGEWLRAANVYPERRPAQAVIIFITIALSVLAIIHFVRRAETRTLAIAHGATVILVALFALESISLHQVDSVLYRPAGLVLAIGWLWLGCGWTTAAAAAESLRK